MPDVLAILLLLLQYHWKKRRLIALFLFTESLIWPLPHRYSISVGEWHLLINRVLYLIECCISYSHNRSSKNVKQYTKENLH